MSNINNTIHTIPAVVGSTTAVVAMWGVSEWCSIVGAIVSVLTYTTYVIFLMIKYAQEKRARAEINREVEQIIHSKVPTVLTKRSVEETPNVGSASRRKSFRARS